MATVNVSGHPKIGTSVIRLRASFGLDAHGRHLGRPGVLRRQVVGSASCFFQSKKLFIAAFEQETINALHNS